MRCTALRAQCCLLGLLVAAGPLLAQSDTAPKPARVLTHVFADPSREFVRLRLVSAVSYRVQVGHAHVTLEARPVSPGVQPPGVRQVFSGEKLTVFVLEPRVTAEYEIRLLGAGNRRVQVTVDRSPRKR